MSFKNPNFAAWVMLGLLLIPVRSLGDDKLDSEVLFDPFDMANYARVKLNEHSEVKAVQKFLEDNRKYCDAFDSGNDADDDDPEEPVMIDPFDMANFNRKKMEKVTEQNAKKKMVREMKNYCRHLRNAGGGGKPSSSKIEEGNGKSSAIIESNSPSAQPLPGESTEDKKITVRQTKIDYHSNKESGPDENSDISASKNSKSDSEAEKLILKRFVQSLYSTLKLQDLTFNENGIKEISLSARISERAERILREIAIAGRDVYTNDLSDLDETFRSLFTLRQNDDFGPSSTLIHMFANVNMHPKNWLFLLFLFNAAVVLLLLYQRSSIWYIVVCSIIIFICFSWFWQWEFLYQQISAQRQADASKFHEMPSSCKLSQLDSFQYAWEKLRGVLPGEDFSCEKYHKTIFTDPVYDINPVDALTDVVTRLAFRPLGYIGEQVGTFFDKLLSATSWYAKIPVFIIITIVILVGCVSVFNLEFRTPFISFGRARAQIPRVEPILYRSAGIVTPLIPAPEDQVQQIQYLHPSGGQSLERSPSTVANSGPVVRLPETPSRPPPPQSVTVVVKMVTDTVGDKKVQNIQELRVESSSKAPPNAEDNPPDFEIIPNSEDVREIDNAEKMENANDPENMLK